MTPRVRGATAGGQPWGGRKSFAHPEAGEGISARRMRGKPEAAWRDVVAKGVDFWFAHKHILTIPIGVVNRKLDKKSDNLKIFFRLWGLQSQANFVSIKAY